MSLPAKEIVSNDSGSNIANQKDKEAAKRSKMNKNKNRYSNRVVRKVYLICR
jgi:hypothetical protein